MESLHKKIMDNTPPSGFVGGMIKMIVGPLGVTFSAWHLSDGQTKRTDLTLKDGDLISIIRVADGIIYVNPFLIEIPFHLNGQDIKGLLISKYTR